ncbi:MAG: phosphoenolpyruvate carboxykinase (GTP) [Candidatus Altiarchaeota archaeon]|nr:phosphoenolpyruvate carboxykinase (GTP) [Candidatus Altiarchaeota archaeon]
MAKKEDALKGFPIKRDYDTRLVQRNELVKFADMYMGYDTLYVWNANINGVIIQLRTNDPHLDDFWRENWFPASCDHNMTPHGVIYAVNGISDTKPSIRYNSESKTGVMFNVNSYGILRSLAMGILMDISEGRKDAHFLRGALVDMNGDGVVITGHPGAGKYTHAFLLLELETARIHSDELIYLEQLGGPKGRISTQASERKFYVNKEVGKISSRVNELFKNSKSDETHVILDPRWIGGEEKYVDTTRIKAIFILDPDPKRSEIARRLTSEEALSLFVNSKPDFFNPHRLVVNDERNELQKDFFQELLQFVACYSLNTAKPLFEVQKKLQDIITSQEYRKAAPVREVEEKPVDLESLVDLKAVRKLVEDMHSMPNVIHPKASEIRSMAEKYGTKTKFGNYNFVSTVKNRSAALTVYVGSPRVAQKKLNPRQKEIIKNLPKTIKEVTEYIQKAPFTCTERTMGENPHFNPYCTLYVSTHRKEMVRLAHMINQTLFDPKKDAKGPKEYLVYIPEWQEKDRQILVFPEIGTTFVLGSDYYGEAKKAFLRMAMWHAKQENMLGLHAGAKILKAKDAKENKIKKYSMLIFGLTATGKTTHSCHNHDLDLPGEGIEIAQDDVVFFRNDGSALGTERGFYLKTEGINPEIQPLIYNAVTKKDAVFENVVVDYQGEVYFGDETLTGNGRGIMQRDDFEKYKAKSVDLPPAEELDGLIIAFITRRHTVVPIAAKLTLEQAAAAYMLGESIETSGSDPKRAGESVREVGTNPFIVGDYATEGNRFYEFIKKYPEKVQCYLLNTGGVGEIIEKDEEGNRIIKQKVKRIEIREMASLIRGIARGTIKWKKDPCFGMLVPEKVEGVDMNKYDPRKFYPQEEIDRYVTELKKERREWLARFPELKPEIRNALKE